MPTVTYEYRGRCEGGGHFLVDVSLEAGPKHRAVYTTDEVRAPLSEILGEEWERFALALMRIHMSGKTRQQMLAEFQAGPVVVVV